MRTLKEAGALIIFLMAGSVAGASQDFPFDTKELAMESVPLQQVLDGTVEAIKPQYCFCTNQWPGY